MTSQSRTGSQRARFSPAANAVYRRFSTHWSEKYTFSLLFAGKGHKAQNLPAKFSPKMVAFHTKLLAKG